MDNFHDYINSLIPDNLTPKKKKELYYELSDHISEKIQYYSELGYSYEQSLNSAKEDFTEDDKTVREISREFEALYSERTLWAVATGVLVTVMNLLCFPLGTWVTSADYNGDPTTAAVSVSFVMIFVVVTLGVIAKIKRWQKTLTALGISNMLIALFFLSAFYPQAAFFAIEKNVFWLLDRFTPIYIGEMTRYSMTYFFYACLVFLVTFSVFCFITAHKIRRGALKSTERPKRKIIVFCTIFILIAAVNVAAFPISSDYMNNYEYFLNEYSQYISPETENLYSAINLGEDYSLAAQTLAANAWVSFDDFAESLDQPSKKRFLNQLENFDIQSDFEIWFNPSKQIDGGGFVGINRNASGTVTGKLIGNIEKSMQGTHGQYASGSMETNCDMDEMLKVFNTLHLGDSEKTVMHDFVNIYGNVYTKLESIENGESTAYYRMCCEGYVTDPQYACDEMQKDETAMYIQITFTNGKLANADLYYTKYENSTPETAVQSVK